MFAWLETTQEEPLVGLHSKVMILAFPGNNGLISVSKAVEPLGLQAKVRLPALSASIKLLD